MFKDLILIKPVLPEQTVITSRFNDRRLRASGWATHHATDFAPVGAFIGLPVNVYASCESHTERVIKADYEPLGFGNYVKTELEGLPVWLYYAHLASVAVKVGDILLPSTVIGVMGHTGFCYSTGHGNGTHLHHEGRGIGERDVRTPFDLGLYYKERLCSSAPL